MHKTQRVTDVAEEILERVERTGGPFGDSPKAVFETEAGRQLEELRTEPHSGKRVREWRRTIRQERTEERHRDQGRAE